MNRVGWAGRTSRVGHHARVLRSRRLLPASVVAAAALLLTAGCTSTPSGSATPSASGAAAATPAPSASASALSCASPGSASGAVKVSGSEGEEPTVSFPKGTEATTTERTVVTAGTGAAIQQGSSASIAYVMYDGKTGKKLDTRGWGSTDPIVLTVDPAQYLPGLVQALACAKEGERLASVIPASQAFGSTGSEQLGVGAGDSLVFVADVVALTPTKASGTAKALPSGFPKVTLAADGQPTVRMPSTKAPTTLKIAESKVGDGETVKSGDTVTVQYQGSLWRNGEVFDQSWGKSGPTSFATTAVVEGFGEALVGAKVGSQVVAIIPPADGYGDNPPSGSSITKTDTMVFVIDVLATAHAG